MGTAKPNPRQPIQPTFGALLRQYRLAAGLSQEELAERAGMSAQSLSVLETGRRQAPYRHTVTLLARALGLSEAETARLEGTIVRARAPAPASASLAADPLSADDALGDLGQRQVKDSSEPSPAHPLLQPDLPTAAPPLLAPRGPRHNLPEHLTGLLGREREVDEVRSLLRTARLVTLAGAGGAGKTRLGLAVAGSMLNEFPDGVWLVELAPLGDPALVVGAVVQALGLREEPGRSLLDTLLTYLKERRLLLVLDNCEHLIGACAALAEAALRTCPRLRILATSRETLAVPGETIYRVPSLAVPDLAHLPDPECLPAYASVALFLERARSRRPGFTLGRQSACAVAEICARLDGMPLAIELAAARVGSLPVEAIATRLGDRFRLLTSGPRTAMPRQQTLRATLDWSYDLLSQPEQRLLDRLAVFAGGCTLEAAEAVCTEPGSEHVHGIPEVLDLLANLVNKSLVLLDEASPEGMQGRYRLLETVRQYGLERLEATAELEPVRDRHLALFLALAEEAAPKLFGGAEAERWLDRLEVEHDNLRAALQWARERGAWQEGPRLAGALADFWLARGYFAEGRNWLEEALAAGGSAPAAVRATALLGNAKLVRAQGSHTHPIPLVEEALALFRRVGDKRGIALCLGDLSYQVWGEFERSAAALQEALGLFEELGDRFGVANCLQHLGMTAFGQKDYTRAAARLEESLVLHRQAGNRKGISDVLHCLGAVAEARGDLKQATARYEEARALLDARRDRRSVAGMLLELARMAHVQCDYSRAMHLYEEGLALFQELGDNEGIASVRHNLGELAYWQGDLAKALGLVQESLVLYQELGHKRGIAYAFSSLGVLAQAQGDYARAATLHEESMAVHRKLGDMGGIATVLIRLATMVHEQGDYARSLSLAQESLALSRDLGAKDQLTAVLECLAWLVMANGQAPQAARLGGAAEGLREAIGVPVWPEQWAGHTHVLQAMRAALSDEAFAAAWAAGRALPLEEAIAEALEDTDPVLRGQ